MRLILNNENFKIPYILSNKSVQERKKKYKQIQKEEEKLGKQKKN